MATAYKYSTTTFTAGSFTTTPWGSSDTFTFDGSALSITASDLTIVQSGTNVNITIGSTGNTLSLNGTTLAAISSSALVLDDGGKVFIGDGASLTTTDNNDNVITGTIYNDYFDGLGNSASGIGDTVSYGNAPGPVVVDLTNSAAQDTVSAGKDKLLNIENLVGSPYNDILTGTATGSQLDGGLGNDVLIGGAGNDTFIVTAGDTITAGAGTDLVKASSDFVLPTNAENLTLTGTTAVYGTGNTTANTIVGNSAGNWLDGSATSSTAAGDGAADSLTGGDGNDTYVVHTGDTVTETSTTGGSADLVIAYSTFSLGNASTSAVENLRLIGAVNGTGNSLANIIYAGTGANTIDGGLSSNDTVSYEYSTSGVTVNLTSNTASGGAAGDSISNVENLTGSQFADNLTSKAAVSTIKGMGGSDTLTSLSNSNVLDGGAGNDTFVLNGFTSTKLSDASGNDTVSVTATFSLATYTSIENLTVASTGASAITGTGNGLANTLTATLTGSGVNNVSLVGGAGNDTYVISDSNSSASVSVVEGASAGTDQVNINVDYTLNNNIENLTFTTSDRTGVGNSVANVITAATDTDANTTGVNFSGLAGNDTLIGSADNDILNGGTGTDKMNGGDGNDTYYVDATADTITDSSGTDIVFSSATFTLPSSIENLTMTNIANTTQTGTGNSSDNIMVSGAGNDKLVGLAGNDSLTGGAGLDTYTGGAGNDTFVLDNSAASADTVSTKDFTTTVDKIDLSAAWTATSTQDIGNQIGSATDDHATNVANLTAAAGTDADVYYVLTTGLDTDLSLADIETAIAAAGGTAGNGKAFGEVTVLVDDGTNTSIYYDAAAQTDAGGGAGMILLGTLLGIHGATALSSGDLFAS